ncbi:hypothetical protein BGZ79_005943 [Entomortierella chlamydospora]|nr:hypothetical protein BGZ79_005943 [Entomortierella chlamydospora]
MAVITAKTVCFPCNIGEKAQEGQYHTQDDLYQGQVEIKEASNYHEQSTGDHPIDAQERPEDSSPALLSFNHVQLALQAYYEPYLNIQRASGDTLNLESCYINLTIVEASDQRQKDKEGLKVRAAGLYRVASYGGITKTNTKAPIPLEKLFDKRLLRDGGEDVPKATLIQGRAGSGKTTLCKKLVNLHQSGLWRDRFDAVLWLPLNQLKGLGARNIEDLLHEKYFAQHLEQERETPVSLTAAHARSGKILFLLDGLDEIILDAKSGNDAALGPLLKYLLRQNHVIITSKPSGVDTSILPTLDLELETIGFSMENVNDYLHRVLNPDTAKVVQGFIKATPLIQDLVSIPVHLDVICFNWDALLLDKDSLTITELYQPMVTKLWCRYLLKKSTAGEELEPRQIKSLSQHQIDQLVAAENEYLGYLAFKGFRDNQIKFHERSLCGAIEELNQHRVKANQELLPPQLPDMLKQTSFLHTADADLDAGMDCSQHAWYFSHLTFQEYFMATWLARHLQIEQNGSISSPTPMMTVEETKAYIRQHKYNPRHHIVWWMLAGLLEGEALTSFFGVLQEAPEDSTGGYHFHLLAACLKEGRSQLDSESAKGLEVQLAQWLHL